MKHFHDIPHASFTPGNIYFSIKLSRGLKYSRSFQQCRMRVPHTSVSIVQPFFPNSAILCSTCLCNRESWGSHFQKPTLDQVYGWQHPCNVFSWQIPPWSPIHLCYHRFHGPAMLLIGNKINGKKLTSKATVSAVIKIICGVLWTTEPVLRIS